VIKINDTALLKSKSDERGLNRTPNPVFEEATRIRNKLVPIKGKDEHLEQKKEKRLSTRNKSSEIN